MRDTSPNRRDQCASSRWVRCPSFSFRCASFGIGTITTVAGTNSGGSCSNNDGVQATSACISSLNGIALDRQGNFYILANTPAPAVRKVNTTGIITTVAGNANFGSSGDGGPATKAGFGTFGGPSQLAIDPAGNLYIVDGSAVRMVNAANGIVTTIVGNNAPEGG
jgi:hypothetical protein